MVFYHGTTEENWKKIQEEGILFGRRFIVDNDGNIVKEVDRCTYLATDINEARHYGNVVLKVEYNPLNEKGQNRKDKKGPLNNWCQDCWQVRVYEPIALDQIELVETCC